MHCNVNSSHQPGPKAMSAPNNTERLILIIVLLAVSYEFLWASFDSIINP